jgi:hypothetical protein
MKTVASAGSAAADVADKEHVSRSAAATGIRIGCLV